MPNKRQEACQRATKTDNQQIKIIHTVHYRTVEPISVHSKRSLLSYSKIFSTFAYSMTILFTYNIITTQRTWKQ